MPEDPPTVIILEETFLGNWNPLTVSVPDRFSALLARMKGRPAVVGRIAVVRAMVVAPARETAPLVSWSVYPMAVDSMSALFRPRPKAKSAALCAPANVFVCLCACNKLLLFYAGLLDWFVAEARDLSCLPTL